MKAFVTWHAKRCNSTYIKFGRTYDAEINSFIGHHQYLVIGEKNACRKYNPNKRHLLVLPWASQGRYLFRKRLCFVVIDHTYYIIAEQNCYRMVWIMFGVYLYIYVYFFSILKASNWCYLFCGFLMYGLVNYFSNSSRDAETASYCCHDSF